MEPKLLTGSVVMGGNSVSMFACVRRFDDGLESLDDSGDDGT